MSLHFHFHLGDLAAAFIQSFLQPFIHTFTHRRRSQPLRVTASSSGAVRVRRLAQRHLNTQLGGAWDRTSYIKGSTIYDVHQTVQQIETNPPYNPSDSFRPYRCSSEGQQRRVCMRMGVCRRSSLAGSALAGIPRGWGSSGGPGGGRRTGRWRWLLWAP